MVDFYTVLGVFIPNTCTADEIQRKANQLQNQLFDIRQQIKKLEKSNDRYIDQGIALLNLASNIKENFLKLDIEQKANVLNILFKKCPVKDKKVKIVWNPPFNYISELGNKGYKGSL